MVSVVPVVHLAEPPVEDIPPVVRACRLLVVLVTLAELRATPVLPADLRVSPASRRDQVAEDEKA